MRMAIAGERAVILLLLLLISFAACRPAAQKVDAAALMREANALLDESNKASAQWSKEYSKTFTPQNRAQFPANRESLRAHADNITKLLDENSSYCQKAIEKYDQAVQTIKDEQQRRGANLITSSLRKSLEINEVVKSQMQLLSDERIVTAEAFNAKFDEGLKQFSKLAT